MENVVVVCPECNRHIDSEVQSCSPGTSEPVLVVTPCVYCYPSPEEQGYAIGEAKENAEEDAVKATLEKLLAVARLMSTNDWDVAPDQTQEQNLRKLIDSDEDLSLVLFNIDRKEKGR